VLGAGLPEPDELPLGFVDDPVEVGVNCHLPSHLGGTTLARPG
jgi:hypothetical protein